MLESMSNAFTAVPFGFLRCVIIMGDDTDATLPALVAPEDEVSFNMSLIFITFPIKFCCHLCHCTLMFYIASY